MRADHLTRQVIARCGGKFAAAHMVAERARQKQDLFRAKQARLQPQKTLEQRPTLLGGKAIAEAMKELVGPALPGANFRRRGGTRSDTEAVTRRLTKRLGGSSNTGPAGATPFLLATNPAGPEQS